MVRYRNKVSSGMNNPLNALLYLTLLFIYLL